ncbi:MAG TPA: hypothetical protein PLU87_00640 [Sedimentisphaerales bacterium]|nr:hypothetical protein [Sedimentisphaerales bacterium]HRS09619.1 hypothetical protein [Sedimentisphaerales bacterium]HRV46300.1 hypothetical protein [Sedimentisphaerales bacterium]
MMNRAIVRITIVGVIHLLMFEALCQWSVHWRESSEELVGLLLQLLLLVGLVWAASAAFGKASGRIRRVLCRAVLVVGLFAGLYTVDYFYFWHIRPNLGLYEEPDWVAQHPGFQRSLQARIEANLWSSAKKAGTSP